MINTPPRYPPGGPAARPPVNDLTNRLTGRFGARNGRIRMPSRARHRTGKPEPPVIRGPERGRSGEVPFRPGQEPREVEPVGARLAGGVKVGARPVAGLGRE